jgi:hypothetical protein
MSTGSENVLRRDRFGSYYVGAFDEPAFSTVSRPLAASRFGGTWRPSDAGGPVAQ